jgi:predicted nucleic acid-binding protein
MLIYCDSDILIYWLDEIGPFYLLAEGRMAILLLAGDRLAVSDLTRLECRVGVLNRNDTAALKVFDDFFARSEVRLVPLTATVFDRAAQMRVDLKVKTPDALHLAAAIEAGCDGFLTNDHRLSQCKDIKVEVLA